MKTTKQFWLAFLLVMICTLLVSMLSLSTYRQNMVDSRKYEIESVLQFTRAQLSIYVDKVNKGLISRKTAESEVVEMLSAMQIDTRYVWANDSNAIARVHVRPEVLGKFQTSYVYHMRELENTPIAFVSEPNVKPIDEVRVLKMNGITKIPEWDWVVGYGAYIDDIESEFLDIVVKTIFINVLIAMLIAALAFFVVKPKHAGTK